MDKLRKPFQGVLNIIRFNWHFYIIAFGTITLLLYYSSYTTPLISRITVYISISILISIIIASVVSFYIYDVSDLYQFNWITPSKKKLTIININAGFDETSTIIKKKYQNAIFITLDFYNPKKHTEVSIKRARKQHPPLPYTKQITTTHIQLENEQADVIFLILSAHEIRNTQERILFFKELNRILKPYGKIFITEHLRDINNIMAYHFGALHFYSKTSWKNIFKIANFNVISEIKNTPFISTFTLEKHGTTL